MSELNTKLYFRVAFLALLLHFASGDCVHLDLGMETGSIPDNNITVSSENNGNPAKKGRLNSESSWCAETNEKDPYLQIDLQTLHIICAVSTQGNSRAEQWVKTYKLQLSTDGSTWTNYKEGGQVKSLSGNEDKNSEVKHILYGGVLARYLRLMPETYNGGKCLRTEVFGVKLKPENLALGKVTDQSSAYNGGERFGVAVSDRAVDGNADTNMLNRHCSQTKKNKPSWWRVDLGSDHVPVSQIYIVNRFSPNDPTKSSKDYKITLGNSRDVTTNPKCLGKYTFIKFKASAVCFTDPLKTGRYVGIMTTTGEALQLCEVEIYSRDNLAYKKQTNQSSIKNGGASSRGVDGNSSTSRPAKSCTHTKKEKKPWWRVDLGKEEQVSEIYIVNRDRHGERLSNFEIRVGTVSDHGGVTNPKCGSNYSVPQGKGLSFFCRPPLNGRYVTIRSLRKDDALTLCEVEVYSERRACAIQAIGVASRNTFPDSSFSASSSGIGNEASRGRLYGNGAWSPSTVKDAEDYLQIDLLYEFVICAVATQGNPNADHWTTQYKLQLSYCGGSWAIYQENNVDKVFNGSSGRNDIVKHSLKEYASARFIRFQPITYKNRIALRVEVFGILLSTVPSQAPSNFTVVASSYTDITASWQLPPENARHGNITGFKLFYRKKGSMGPLLNLTIDGGEKRSKDVTGLARDTEYEFQVLAFTSVGDGPKSSIKVGSTREGVPSEAPSSFSITAKNSTSIEASWKSPPNRFITGFKLFYKKKGSPGPSKSLTIKSGLTLTKVVTELEKYTEYEFQVLAFTSAGDGPNSSVKYNTTMQDAPSQAPSRFSVTAKSSGSIEASWQLPPANSSNGIITGFKLFYKKKSFSGSVTPVTIKGSTLTKVVTGLDKYTEYEFQVLAFTSVGDGPRSSVKYETTMEDAPDVPATFNYTNVAPDMSHGPKVNLTWSRPLEANGIIRNYTLFYGHEKDKREETFGKNTLSYSVDVLGGLTYQFHVRAVTIKPGENASLTVNVPEYEPSVGPDNVLFSELNQTTFNISWASLTREKSYGKVILYEVKEELLSRGKRRKRSLNNSRKSNTTVTFAVLFDLLLCSRYNVSVRAYTKAGPGPYSQPLVLETSRPEPPLDLKEKKSGTIDITLEWKEPNITIRGATNYTVKYSGTKSYNKSFKDGSSKKAIKSTTYSVKNLVPGSQYDFEVYATSVCGKSSSIYVTVETRIEAPIAPVVPYLTYVTVTESFAGIHLWPVEQRNGPISAYQVIVLKVVKEAKELPDDFKLKLDDAVSPKEDNVNFYIAAEIPNDPVYKESWKFTIGNDTTDGGFVNKALERGEEYIIFQRAVTRAKDLILVGEVGKVASIVVAEDVEGKDKTEGSDSFNPVFVAVPVVLLLLILTALIVVVWYRRKKQQQRKNKRDSTPFQLDEIPPLHSADTTAGSTNPVYQNVADIRQDNQDVVEATPPEEKNVVYSEADGKPKPIPVAEFARYFRNKSSNGAIVLREEFRNLPSSLEFTWEVGKINRAKNRYGNITSYDHSRVVLEKIEGDPKSDYINASYIPTFDEETMRYIATQGPTQETLTDFWRMIWQENCASIVMLTNLVEMGKKKCEQYWPDSATKYGSISVTLRETKNFADYVVRTFILVKDSEKREVLQFHYVTWPDKGVPERSTALLGFRWKVHGRHQATGGPLVVHCSAGVGRTGTYIAIDAMLEGAGVKKSVFIQNYVQVMRRCRPYMVQKEEQYVFLHQAVMEALTCGNTEIAPHDLRIAINKLARTKKFSQTNGFSNEFKRLELVSACQSLGNESEAGFKPSSIKKNRFPNIVPLDSSRVFLSSSEPEKNYINASFVDDYKQRGAYILTQAPLDNTVEDLWNMISQYEIATIVMLNSLKEEKENYPQYWPAEGSAQYGSIILRKISEKTSKNITTRMFSVSNAERPRKQLAVQHLHFNGWSKPDSCPDPKEILDLLTAIQQSQQQTGNGVIVFQCSDGVGRSGCVSSIMSVIERVKREQTVDVFQTVKLIRARRPGAVDTLDRYEFCYKTIQAYLDSFSTYANFADC